MTLRSFALSALLVACAAPALAQQRAPSPTAPAQAPAPVQPASIEVPMTVKLMRLADPACEPDCPEWISAMGRIDESTPGEFRKVLAKLGGRKLPVMIDSAGGTVDAGLAVGRMVRAKGLDVVVTKTTFAACPHSDAECRKFKARGIEFGKPDPKISKCASSCAFILAGGARRYVGPWTLVGLHQIKVIATKRLVQRHYMVERRLQYGVPVEMKRSLVKEVTLATETKEREADEKLYERVRKYFVEMGISETVMPILRSAVNSSIHWVRVAELKSTGLATDFLNGAQLLTPQNAPLPPVIAQGVSPPVASAAAPGTPAIMAPLLPPAPGATPSAGCPEGAPGQSCITTGSLPTRTVSPGIAVSAPAANVAPAEAKPEAAPVVTPAAPAIKTEAAPAVAAPATVTVTAAPASVAPVVESVKAAPARAVPPPAPPAKAEAPAPVKADAAAAPIAPKPKPAAQTRAQREDRSGANPFNGN